MREENDVLPASIDDDAADAGFPIGFASEINGGGQFGDDEIVQRQILCRGSVSIVVDEWSLRTETCIEITD